MLHIFKNWPCGLNIWSYSNTIHLYTVTPSFSDFVCVKSPAAPCETTFHLRAIHMDPKGKIKHNVATVSQKRANLRWSQRWGIPPPPSFCQQQQQKSETPQGGRIATYRILISVFLQSLPDELQTFQSLFLLRILSIPLVQCGNFLSTNKNKIIFSSYRRLRSEPLYNNKSIH